MSTKYGARHGATAAPPFFPVVRRASFSTGIPPCRPVRLNTTGGVVASHSLLRSLSRAGTSTSPPLPAVAAPPPLPPTPVLSQPLPLTPCRCPASIRTNPSRPTSYFYTLHCLSARRPPTSFLSQVSFAIAFKKIPSIRFLSRSSDLRNSREINECIKYFIIFDFVKKFCLRYFSLRRKLVFAEYKLLHYPRLIPSFLDVCSKSVTVDIRTYSS